MINRINSGFTFCVFGILARNGCVLGIIFSCITSAFAQSVGIGATQFVPSGMLEVRGTSTASTDYALKIRNSTPADMLVVQNNGNVGINTPTPSVKLHVTGDTWVTGHAGIGTGAAPSTNDNLYVFDLFMTGNASRRTGIFCTPQLFPLGVSQTGAFAGIYCQPILAALISATVSNIYGIYVETNLAAGAGTVSNYYSYCAKNPIIVGTTVTNSYGLYIDNITGATNNYSIYSAGGQNYLAGSLSVGSSFSLPLSIKITNYTITVSDHTLLANATAGGFTITLPTAVGITGRMYVIKKTDATANIVAVQTTSAQTIDGAAPPVNIAIANDRIVVQSDGTNWVRID